MAFSLTGDPGCEYGGGVGCSHNGKGGPKQSVAGWILYNRFWFKNDRYAITVGAGAMDNPGRYFVLLPPINGADAVSGSPNFAQNPGDPFKAWEASFPFDWMPKQCIAFRVEYGYRHAGVPYLSGPGGITPPGVNTGLPSVFGGENAGSPGQFVCNDRSAVSDPALCGPVGAWFPDLRRNETSVRLAIMVKS
jgi:hypothetical protein